MRRVLSIHAPACVLLLAFAAIPALAQNQPGLNMQVQSERGAMFPSEAVRGTGIALKAWDYSVALPTNESGMVTGARRYAPVSIEKPIGNASPNFLRAMLSNELLNITIDVVGAGGPTGTPVLLHRVTFAQARIISVTRNATGPMERAAGTSGVVGEMTETIKFEFRRVEFDPGRPNGSLMDDLDTN